MPGRDCPGSFCEDQMLRGSVMRGVLSDAEKAGTDAFAPDPVSCFRVPSGARGAGGAFFPKKIRPEMSV